MLVMERYQQWRRFDTASLAAATDVFNRLFSNDNPLLRLGRDIGMGLAGSLPGLRRGFVREAAGLTGDLPRTAAGPPDLKPGPPAASGTSMGCPCTVGPLHRAAARCRSTEHLRHAGNRTRRFPAAPAPDL